jgi:hypothetical protein
LNVTDDPVGNSLGAIVVVEGGNVLSGLVDGNSSVDLGSDIDEGSLAGLFSKEILVPAEVPLLELGLGNLEVRGGILSSGSLFGNGEAEVTIWDTTVGLGSVHRSVNLETDVKVLTSEEISLIRRENTT